MKEVNVLCLTYGRLRELVAGATEKLERIPVCITAINGLSETVSDQIMEAIDRGVDVIVAGGSNADFAKRRFDIPVVPIRISAYDYVEAIGRAKRLGRRIAVLVLEGGWAFDFLRMGKLLSAEVSVVSYRVGEDLGALIQGCGADVVIGASHAAEVADALGLPTVLIYPGEETIVAAILEGNKLVREMWQERERSELTNALIRSTPNSIVIINEQGQIIAFNGEAERAYGVSALSVKGKQLSTVLEGCTLEALLIQDGDPDASIRTIGEHMYLQKHIQITQEKLVVGAIEILAELSAFRHAEYRYNVEQEKKNQIKGFQAKAHFLDIVGSGRCIREAIDEARFFARSDASILIYGETGTGKELFAQSIHNFSNRRKGPFIAINCAALPESLLESELFGYEEGAFTGSKKGGKMGIFELADGGTIFLDEIGEIGLPLQARLLRVLQEREVMRIGGERIYRIDVRVVAATNKNIDHMGEKEFRRDLLYRLKVLELNLPSLRQRGDDVAELFLTFLRQRSPLAESGPELSEEILAMLKEYSWPGNIRELLNVCERFCIYMGNTAGPTERMARRILLRSIGAERLLEDILSRYGFRPGEKIEPNESFFQLLKTLRACFEYGNDQLAAALGISRTTLWRLERQESPGPG